MSKPTPTPSKYAPRWKPFPWSRFSADEFPREKPLPVCPASKCRRAKACLAAHCGLFCQRTHFDRTEGLARTPQTELDKHIASIELPPASSTPELHMVYLNEIAALRRAEQREKMKLWRAGAYVDSYGRYHTRGVMKPPPPRIYVED